MVYQKKVDKSEIALCFAKRLNIRCFFIKRDCFGNYNLEYTKKIRNLKLQYPGGFCLLRQYKYALRTKLKCLKVILTW